MVVRSNEKDLLLGQIHDFYIHLKTVIQSRTKRLALRVVPYVNS